jgi:hypothetical protein
MAPAKKKFTLSPDSPLSTKARGKDAVVKAAIKELSPVVDTKSGKPVYEVKMRVSSIVRARVIFL